MRNSLNPKLLFIINMLPIVLLFVIFIGEYQVVKSLLNENHWQNWMIFGSTLGILSLFTNVYALVKTQQNQPISLRYGLLSLFAYVLFLYAYVHHISEIFPSNIPQWIMPVEIQLYVGSFIMPTLAHALLVVVLELTKPDDNHKIGKNIIATLAIPLAWFAFLQLILPLWQNIESNRFLQHLTSIFYISGVVLFMFFLVRSIFILLQKKSSFLSENTFIFKIIIGIILPILGLLLNDGLIGKLFQKNIFGDFGNPWFYILAVLNGVLICLPNPKKISLRLWLFLARSLTLAYTFYFFMVFLPYLPLSIFLIVAFGLGFLMLTPLMLMLVHASILGSDFEALKVYFSSKKLIIYAFSAFLVLPIAITLISIYDKKVLNNALSYIYQPDFSANQTNLDKISLAKTLDLIKSNKASSNQGELTLFSPQTPFLSAFYNSMVLDNLILSDAKIDKIESIFLGKQATTIRPVAMENPTKNIKISSCKSNSYFDEKQNAWSSWIDLEISNGSDNLQEYSSNFELPAGCWVSDYYLYVGDKKEMGILAEKKTANWIFNQITKTRQDPGLLSYQTGNKIGFKIFPFTANETRKTGIQLLHKEPFTLTIDGKKIMLGNENQQLTIEKTTSNVNAVTYISAKEKANLEKVKRVPYYHFIVDVSDKSIADTTLYKQRIDSLLAKNYFSPKNSKISFTNAYIQNTDLDNNWTKKLQAQSFEGGFYLDRAIKKALFTSFTSKNNSEYPVIVVVSNHFDHAIVKNNFSDFALAFPESDYFFTLEKNGQLAFHSLIDKPKDNLGLCNTLTTNEVVHFSKNKTDVYLRNDQQASIAFNNAFSSNENQESEKDWQTGLAMQGRYLSQVFYPKNGEQEWLNLLKMSFQSKIMMPFTAYMVVETEAQKAMLLKKQAQVLASNKNLDLEEEPQRMSEPDLFILLLLMGLFFAFYKKW